MSKIKDLSASLDELLEGVLETPNVVSADLETGSHHLNNYAASQFAKKHRILMQHLDKLVTLAQSIADAAEKD